MEITQFFLRFEPQGLREKLELYNNVLYMYVYCIIFGLKKCILTSKLKQIMLNKRPRRASLLPIIYFMGNRILLSCFIIRMTAKSSFLSSILLIEAMDQGEPPLSLLFRHPSIYQKVPFVSIERADQTMNGIKVVPTCSAFQTLPYP